MTPEKKSSNINTQAIGHSGNLEGSLQEDHYDKDNSSSVQEYQGLNTDQLQQVAPAPDTSGALILTAGEKPAFKEKYSALVESHEPVESHTVRNTLYAVGGAGLLAAGILTGVNIANNQAPDTPTEANPSATSTPSAGETQAPASQKPVESPLASPSNIAPLETQQPTPSKPEAGPGALNEFGITAAEEKQIEKSLSIDAATHTTPEQVTNAFMNTLDTYFAGGHSMETRNAHLDDDTPKGQVGWNAWSNELYTKELSETVFMPSVLDRPDSPIPNLTDNKSIVNRLWVNSAKAGEKEYKSTTSFEIDSVSDVTENGFTVVGAETRVDNSNEVPSAASDSARIIDEIRTENVKISFIKIDGQWRVVDYVGVG